MRTALFMNNMKVFLNHPNDPIDDSEHTTMALKDIDHREKMRNMLRMVDYNAKWADDYDSVYGCGKMVVKNNSQQIVLSIHIIDKNTLGEKWDEDEQGYDFL